MSNPANGLVSALGVDLGVSSTLGTSTSTVSVGVAPPNTPLSKSTALVSVVEEVSTCTVSTFVGVSEVVWGYPFALP